jgi:hypothetical protein
MRVHQACVLVALTTAIPAAAFAEGAQPVVKLPNEMEFKAPVSPGPQNVVLYGDPTKAGVYVQRTKLAPGLKVMPHWHPDEWRTAVVSGKPGLGRASGGGAARWAMALTPVCAPGLPRLPCAVRLL